MNVKKLLWYLGAVRDPAQDLVTYYGDDLVYFLDPANLNTMFKENATNSTPVTHVSADADAIGLIYDRGYHGFYATAESDATRPTLGSDATQLSYINFTLSPASRFRIINTASYLRTFHLAGSTWTIATRIKMGSSTDGVANVLLASHTGTTANFGLRLVRGSDNKVSIWIVYGSAGNSRVNYNSTKTIIEADGWVDLIVYANGTSGTMIIGSTTESFSLTAAGSSSNATSDMYVGSTTFGAANLKGGMGYLIILNRIPTADEITNLKSYNPSRNSSNWVVNTTEYNFNNSARGWADLAKTTPITNGVAVRVWEPEIASIFGPLNRDLTSASAGTSPIWNTSLQNGKAGLTYDGVNDNLGFSSALFNERGGTGVLTVIAKNTRANLGSHFLSGSNYLVGTGSTYPSGVLGVGNTYFTVHPAGGSGGIGPNLFKNLVESTNIMIARRNGSDWAEWTGRKVKTTISDPNLFIANNSGTEFIVGWQLQGNVFKIKLESGIKTDTEIEAYIDLENTAYGM